ncbi:MAG: hypothetical protein GY751_19090 [Bacteroidetes bacterium]|nr:hypothetical protein [Bacteroidota bacterium]
MREVLGWLPQESIRPKTFMNLHGQLLTDHLNNKKNDLWIVSPTLHITVHRVSIVMDTEAFAFGPAPQNRPEKQVDLFSQRLGMMLSNAILHISHSLTAWILQDKSRLERGLVVGRHALAWRQPFITDNRKKSFKTFRAGHHFQSRMVVY